LSVDFEEAFHVSTRSIVTTALVLTALGIVASPVYAQGAAPAASNSATIIQWSILTAGFALGIAAGLGALGQGRAVAASSGRSALRPRFAGLS
jgi:F0F1-type ATP synthase membrane subunit c/vacuolar-type H+-ATPase subunit K